MVETLQRAMSTNGSPNARQSKTERHRKDHEANERLRTSDTTASANARQWDRDRAIETQVRAELQKSSYHPVRQVSCDVCRSVIRLSGRVPSFYLKQVAQTIVRRLLEVSLAIENHLEAD